MRTDQERGVTAAAALRGVAAGVAGGLAGAWTMNRFQDAWSKVSEAISLGDKQDKSDEPAQEAQAREPATVQAAEAISEQVFGHDLTESGKRTAGPAVHYVFGAAMGGLYGGLAAWRRQTAAAAGLPFATALWLFADEVGVPAAGLSGSSTKTPLSGHVSALLAHLVYGVTTDAVRRGVLAASGHARA
jgi:hypothetical protein